MAYKERVAEAARFLSDRISTSPDIGVMTGTGLGDAAVLPNAEFSIEYGKIPNFPVSTVDGHLGRISAGSICGKSVLALQGRFHLYEGYTVDDVVFPVRVMQELGVKILILSNAAGGLNPVFSPGDIMIISDHINLTGQNPLKGPNHDSWGIRFPDMTHAYDNKLADIVEIQAELKNISIRKGVYAGIHGPSLETPAETRYLRLIKADAVGFSTVCEVIAGVHAGMRILGLSVITNVNDPEKSEPVTLEAVVAAAGKAAPRVRKIIHTLMEKMDEQAF